jgi:hypothetical protein
LRIGLLEKEEEDVMLITDDAMSIDRICNKISSEWNVDFMSLERNGGVTLSTFHDWHMADGEFELQRSITKVSRKLEQSPCTCKKRL